MQIASLSRWRMGWVGAVPFLAVLVAWQTVPLLYSFPSYMLPAPSSVAARVYALVSSGTLQDNLATSLARLTVGFAIGSSLALILGIAIALNRTVSELLRPTLTFLQAIAGIAWVPLAIIWFGIGHGAVVFVIANTIFFSLLNNAVTGVQQIPTVLMRAALSHGARPFNIFWSLLLPGSLIQVILGLRTAVAYGWRALVAGEMLGGAGGLGYMIIEAVQFFETETIIVGMLTIGLLWLVMDRAIFSVLERRTVVRWGLLRR